MTPDKQAERALIDALDRYLRQDETANDTDNGLYRQGMAAMSAALSTTPPAAAEAPAVPDESKAQKDFAGLLFDFVGWMTSGEPLWIFSSRCDATPGVEAIAQFAKMRGLRLDDPNIRDWHAALAAQPKADSSEGKCPYCTSDIPEVQAIYFDQNCTGCVARMTGGIASPTKEGNHG